MTLGRRVYASFGPKRHAFEYTRREATRRGFGPATGKTVQLVTDGDLDLQRYADELLPASDFPNLVRTIDVMHVVEKLRLAGCNWLKEGSPELAAWVEAQKARLYDDRAADIVSELQERLTATPKTGPGNKGRRERLEKVAAFLEKRLPLMNYGTLRALDLEVGSGQVEGAVNYLVAKRFDHGGMRWIKERAQALLQLRCIDVNGHWQDFIDFVVRHQRNAAAAAGQATRLQSSTAANLPESRRAA